MGGQQQGLKRRVQLLGAALRPPRSIVPERKAGAAAAVAKSQESAAAAAPAPAKKGGRPPKKTVSFDYGVPIASRQVDSPVFVLSPVRSGSTLLRMLLNSHSRIRAP